LSSYFTLKGKKIIVTSGPTREPLDDLRFLSNVSTGRLGAGIAEEAARRGAVVVYVAGPGAALPAPVAAGEAGFTSGEEGELRRLALQAPPGSLFLLRVGTAAEASAALERLLRGLEPEAVVHTMAVADFAPAKALKGKMPSREGELVIRLEPTPKILPRLREWAPGAVVVAAKFESGVGEEELLRRAAALLEHSDAVVATRREEWEPVHRAFFLAPPDPPRQLAGKEAIAREVLNFLGSRLGEEGETPPKGGAFPLHTARIAVCVGAGVAASKTPHLVSLLREKGAEVEVLLTRRASRFVSPLVLAALSGHPVHRHHLRGEPEPLPHVRLGREVDAAQVAPATSDLLARLRLGLADDAVTDFLLTLGTRRPVLLCPAMHTAMWENPVVQEHVEALRRRGYLFLGPAEGRLAGGDWGVGRMEEPEVIVERLESLLFAPGRRE
jgi:phosphopantothenoylcysteine synthetase/decarboxylase